MPVFLIEHPPFFERDDPKPGRGLYQQTMPGGYKADYPDNGERFVFFCRAVLELDPAPRVPAGRDPRQRLADRPRPGVPRARCTASSPGYQRIRSVFTIHNIAYQGSFPRELMNLTGLPGVAVQPRPARVLRA